MPTLDSRHLHRSLTKGVIVALIVRDEVLRLPWIFKYYETLGCAGFLVIDDNSSDGTVELVRNMENTLLFHAEDSLFEDNHCGTDWINDAISKHGLDRWILKIDADELLCWPQATQEGLNGLTQRLDALGLKSAFTPLIDVYPDTALCDAKPYLPGDPFQDHCDWVDPIYDYLANWDGQGRLRIHGGPRGRFAPKGDKGPLMTKQALFFHDSIGLRMNGSHFLTSPLPSPVVTPILHYKFLSDFGSRCNKAIEENKHWNNASEYRHYLASDFERTVFKYSESIRINSCSDLAHHINAFENLIRRGPVNGLIRLG